MGLGFVFVMMYQAKVPPLGLTVDVQDPFVVEVGAVDPRAKSVGLQFMLAVGVVLPPALACGEPLGQTGVPPLQTWPVVSMTLSQVA